MPPKNSSYVMISEHQIERKQTFSERISYCCKCVCTDCLNIRLPNVETKVADKIEVVFN